MTKAAHQEAEHSKKPGGSFANSGLKELSQKPYRSGPGQNLDQGQKSESACRYSRDRWYFLICEFWRGFVSSFAVPPVLMHYCLRVALPASAYELHALAFEGGGAPCYR